MAKFYVKIGALIPAPDAKKYMPKEVTFQEIVSAGDELDACVKVWLRIRIDIRKSTWKVGELGFDNHDDYIFFEAGQIIRAIRKYQRNRKDGA
jgi:hypothetical protein